MVPSIPFEFTHTTSDAGSITLQWLPPVHEGGAMITGYHIYSKLDEESTWTQSDLISADNFSFTVDSLTADKRYALKIVAVNEKGLSEQSNIHY